MKTNLLKKCLSARTGLVIGFMFLVVTISMITRVVLWARSWPDTDHGVSATVGILFMGLFYDIVNAIYVSLPIVLYTWLVPSALYKRRWNLYFVYACCFIFSGLLLFNGVAEWFFWDEFSGRFNFIAVDYLVYTTEVLGNIQQSYPVGWIITIIALGAWGITSAARTWIKARLAEDQPFRQRSHAVALFTGAFILSLLFVNTRLHHFSKNTYVNELAGNGLYELFAAYRHNELDYEKFYKSIDHAQAFKLIRTLVKTPEAVFVDSAGESITRKIIHHGSERRLNVVLISVESFSAEFMGRFGNEKNITPFLDSVSHHSLIFTNLYATGTRTVRGLEALSLCVPPTPGQSIVRRPNNEDLYSMGQVFTAKGYKSEYIYGGYGYFDNMNYFFGHNRYHVVDRTSLRDDEIAYENIWGVADENLFDLTLKEMDAGTPGSPVFAHVMTTSNHRPYTYPQGRIDIPSHTSRDGAVKYTDYAIGRFIRQASHKPWFNNTVFVIVADHCASSAGKTELPASKYHIPLLIYSPGNIKPGTMDRLMSQIDIGPTLLGMLNFSYTSNFYGYDMYALEPGRERAFISTYQNLGYIRNNKLVILSPQMKTASFAFTDTQDDTQEPLERESRKTTTEAIAWYQTASYAFTHGHMKYSEPIALKK